jgi:hypothetical protein
MTNEHSIETKESPSWQLPAMVVLGLIALGGLWFGWNASSKLDATQQSLTTQLKAAVEPMQQEVTSLKAHVAEYEKANSNLQGDLNVVTKKLKITQGQLKNAREETAKLNDVTSQRLTALDTSVKSELATKANSDELKTVDSKVGGVRTDLDSTREELKMARSEMGTLIARNHDEIDQLRRLGERDYLEFTISGKNKPQKVGNVTLELKGVNQKRNQYSVLMTVEDKRYVKTNRALNEPVFFYTSGAHLPEELVINKVSKDQISGYVSIPKANAQPQSATSASGS